MTVTPLRTAAAAGLLAVCAVPFGIPALGRGQQPAEGRVAGHTVVYNGCYDCHYNGPNPRHKANGADKLLRLTESRIVNEQDLHCRAIESLKGDLGRQMGRLLYEDEDVTKRPACLTCHAVDLTSKQGTGGHGEATTDFFTEFGVSCEACHGIAALDNQNWYVKHQDPAWRKTLPKDKEAKGQIDLRNPVVRAECCAGCHVGNAAEGKLVTHAMYAAGHPPLPPLEVALFSRDQPSHAIPPKENEYINGLSDDDAGKLFHVRKSESAAARQSAVGAAVGFGAAMKTLASAADDAAKNGRPLDFALFDCAACHHDLITPSRRQERGFAGTPGRPQPRSGPTALLRTVAGGEADAFEAKFKALVKACDAKPFGDPAAIASAAGDLAAWADGVAKKLNDAGYKDDRVAELRRTIADAGARKARDLDYENAQQLLWAFESLKDESPAVPPRVTEDLGRLAGLPGSDTPMIGPLWEKGRWEPGKRPLVADTLARRLGRYALFEQDPDPFRRAFEKIAAQLEPAGR